MKIFVRFFDNEVMAKSHCEFLNLRDGVRLYRVIDGPEDNFAVVDIETAQDIAGDETVCRDCGEPIDPNRGGRCYGCGQQERREDAAQCEADSRESQEEA